MTGIKDENSRDDASEIRSPGGVSSSADQGGGHSAGRPGGIAPGLPGSTSESEREGWGSLGGGYGEQTTGISGPRRRARPPTRGGPYAGSGTEGDERSDEQIREDVCELLGEHDQLDMADIEVEVREAEVRLSGTVDSDALKEMAEEVAGGVSGVKRIVNALRVPDTGVGGDVGGRVGTRGGGRGSALTGRGT
ncbi:BON domain-containing protein [Sorangium sp. So ce291]|uniref:BON domain-containing protein n=1 Tax=Sorangium sp. So ce291 TaxID=3133294 RepID=UPI003F5F9FCF